MHGHAASSVVLLVLVATGCLSVPSPLSAERDGGVVASEDGANGPCDAQVAFGFDDTAALGAWTADRNGDCSYEVLDGELVLSTAGNDAFSCVLTSRARFDLRGGRAAIRLAERGGMPFWWRVIDAGGGMYHVQALMTTIGGARCSASESCEWTGSTNDVDGVTALALHHDPIAERLELQTYDGTGWAAFHSFPLTEPGVLACTSLEIGTSADPAIGATATAFDGATVGPAD